MDLIRLEDWTVILNQWRPEREALVRVLCTLGNGLFTHHGYSDEVVVDQNRPSGVLCGTLCERRLAADSSSDPAATLAVAETEALLTWPDWTGLNFRHEGEEWFDIQHPGLEIQSTRIELDLRRGALRRKLRFRDPVGRETEIQTQRLVHMSRPHLAAMQWTLTPLNWTGPIDVCSWLDAGDPNLIILLSESLSREHAALLVRHSSHPTRLAMVSRTRIDPDQHDWVRQAEGARVGHRCRIQVEGPQPIRIEKRVAMRSNRDLATGDPWTTARRDLDPWANFQAMAMTHERAWTRRWRRYDLSLIDGTSTQLALRLQAFHLLQSISASTEIRETGLPAFGLHHPNGRACQGDDDVFVIPFFNLRQPDLSRDLLRARVGRLDTARDRARRIGRAGAAFPIRAGRDGTDLANDEEAMGFEQAIQSFLVGFGICYGLIDYVLTTSDMAFLDAHGAELLVEVTRFGAGLAVFDSERQRYSTPLSNTTIDSRLTGTSDASQTESENARDSDGGPNFGPIHDSALVNLALAWLLQNTREALTMLTEERSRELLEELNLTPDELSHWEDLAHRLVVPLNKDGSLAPYINDRPVTDRAMEPEATSGGGSFAINEGAISQDAAVDNASLERTLDPRDVLAPLALFRRKTLLSLIGDLGYRFDEAGLDATLDRARANDPESRTGIAEQVRQARALSGLRPDAAWRVVQDWLRMDRDDRLGGITGSGLATGSMSGILDLIQRDFTGLRIHRGVMWFEPRLPGPIKTFQMSFRCRGFHMALQLQKDRLLVRCELVPDRPARIGVAGQVSTIARGEVLEFAIDPKLT